MLLSILIASTKSRERLLVTLLKEINKQITDTTKAQVIVNRHEDDCVGKKRNDLLEAASGDYIVFVDSDDHIMPNYVKSILEAIEQRPDCIGISGYITTNRKNKKKWHISKDFGSWYEKGNCYFRTTNHISPVKRLLALQVGFPEINHGEDYDYSMRLLPLLETEVVIKGGLYHYDYSNKRK